MFCKDTAFLTAYGYRLESFIKVEEIIYKYIKDYEINTTQDESRLFRVVKIMLLMLHGVDNIKNNELSNKELIYLNGYVGVTLQEKINNFVKHSFCVFGYENIQPEDMLNNLKKVLKYQKDFHNY